MHSSKLTTAEATELFFASTKLFVDVQDMSLRRLVYLFIKEIQPLCDPSDVIIVTSCLTKDMTCDVGLYRANAIRVLVNIIDSAMLGSIERYIKQAIVDNDVLVSNAALVSASHLFEQSAENASIVRRWVGEVQEKVLIDDEQRSSSTNTRAKSDATSNYMVQANAMRLLCQMKSHDRLGMAKLVQKFGKEAGSGIQSPLALVILIRLCGKLLTEEVATYYYNSSTGDRGGDIRETSSLCKLCFDFLESSLSHGNDMIRYEAARIICLLPDLATHNLTRAMECMRKMLLSDKPSARFAAVNTLSTVSNRRAVALCAEGLEQCVDDDNKQIATLAVTTLLTTGSEATIDKVLGTLPSLLGNVEDEHRIKLIRSLEELCLKYLSKYRAIVSFMSNLLRDEGSFEFKHSIVNSIVSLMGQVPEMTEISLLHLCDFIDDCEYTMLATKCIHIIADVGPTTNAPSQYIRFIYNRVILNNASIRAAAVTALSKFAAQSPSLRASIMALLKNCLQDEDDETRDRASMAVSVLKEAMERNPYVAPDIEEYEEIAPDVPMEGDVAAVVYLQSLPMSLNHLERSIKAYVSTPDAMESSEPLTLTILPIIEDTIEDTALDASPILANEVNGHNKPTKAEIRDQAAAVYAIPELAELGRVFRSSTAIPLTEEETEYVVRCIKHIMPEHVVLQFIVQNTVEGQRLDNCTVAIDSENNSEVYQIIGDVPAEKVEYGKTANTFTVIQRHATRPIEPISFTCQLNFTAVQVDPDSGESFDDGYAEEYSLERLLITPADFMAKVAVADFKQTWNGTDDSNEALGNFTMQSKSMDEAVMAVTDLVGMAICDNTGHLPRNSADLTHHMLHLSGTFLGGHEVLARAQLKVKQGEGTMLKIAIRSVDKTISEAVMNCIN